MDKRHRLLSREYIIQTDPNSSSIHIGLHRRTIIKIRGNLIPLKQ